MNTLLPFSTTPGVLFTSKHPGLLWLNFIAGCLITLGFEPFGQGWLVYLLLSFLFLSWLHCSAGRALLVGWLFGLGMQMTGICWIFYSLYYHGGSPAFLAVLLVVLMAAYLALFPAIAGYFINRYFKQDEMIRLVLLYPLAWSMMEWFQGIFLTGFSWMQLGYSQVDSPLSGYAPLFGSHGVTFFVAVTSGLLLFIFLNMKQLKTRHVIFSVFLLASTWLLGIVIKQYEWTEPAGGSIKVSIVQGNVPQHLKWRRDMLQPTLKMYRELSEQIEDTDLIIWPETAIPDYQHRITNYLDELKTIMQQRDTDLLLGLFVRDAAKQRYYNSLVNVRGGNYHKRHLVPLGEYIPLRPLIGFFNRWIHIPMSDLEPGQDEQLLLRAAGYPLGVSICFEDAFARDVLRDLPEAAILVNVSNDAWFDGSHQAYQHHAIARMRAIETGRYMLRATNTGVSSVIAPGGNELAVSQRYHVDVLNVDVLPMRGSTPYVVWGDYFLLVTGIVVLVFFRLRQLREGM